MSGVAQWLACWAHNPKVPGSKPGFATQCYTSLFNSACFAGVKKHHAIVSQTGVWTGLQPQGCGDTERFNSSSVAAGAAQRGAIECACWESNPGHKHGGLVCCHYTTCAHEILNVRVLFPARQLGRDHCGRQKGGSEKRSAVHQMTLWLSG